MTLMEYFEKMNMSKAELARHLDIDYNDINHLLTGRSTRKKEVIDKLKQIGIEVPDLIKKEKDPSYCFLSQEKRNINHSTKGDIYCYYKKQIDQITEYLNRKRIAYYVRPLGDDVWHVKYDKKVEVNEDDK